MNNSHLDDIFSSWYKRKLPVQMTSVVIHGGAERGADSVSFFRNFMKQLQFFQLPQFFAISHE